jgi:serine/threonine protein kinase/lipoprotein NlpI
MSDIHHNNSAKLEQLRQKRKESIAKRDWENALHVMNQIVEIEANTDNYNQCGLLLLQLQRHQEALQSFEKAIALSPDSKQALEGIARAQSKGSASGIVARQGSDQGSLKKTLVAAETMPKMLARYQIKKELGRGGMGTVYCAYDPDLKREVALKTILPGSDGQILKRFANEAEAMSKLVHPHIVKIYDVGNAGETPYLTMEFIDGKSLSEMIREEKLPLRRAMEIMKKVTLAIHYAHGKGILHRDIKPANIMIDSKGEPRVMDFGLALDVSREVRLSQTGIAVGTPAYMSPEQALGKKKEIDERSDVYSLGAVMYELLAGVAPFRGATSQIVFQQVIDKEPLSPRKIVPRLPKELEKICLTAMAKEKGQRYLNAEEFAKDIDRFLNKKMVLASGPNLVHRAKKWVKQNRVPAAIAGAVVVVLLCALVFYAKIQAKERELIVARQKAREAEEKIKKEAEEKIREAERRVREAQLEADRKAKLAADRKAREAQLEAERKAREAKLAADKINQNSGAHPANRTGKQNAQAILYNNQGIEYWEQGKKEEAVQAFKQAIAMEPNTVSAHSNLAAVYAEQGQYEDALAELQTALRIDPEYAKAYNNLGVIYHQQHKYTEALAAFQKAVILDPDSRQHLKNLANIYYEKGDLASAATIYEKIVAQGNEELVILKRLGIIYYRLKKFADAVRTYATLAKLCPQDAEVLEKLGAMYYANHQVEEAIKILHNAIKLNPELQDANNNLGVIYFSQGKNDEALAAFDKSLAINPDAIETHFNLAKLYLKTGNNGKALLHAQKYVELAPDNNNKKEMRKLIADLQKQAGGSK